MSAAVDSPTTEANPVPIAGTTAPEATAPPRRKFKASDLPLPSATRSAIERLAHNFKKKGGYDAIRKQVWEKFEASVWHHLFGSPRSVILALV